MKILYELVITEETGFTATDFPDRFEILRKGKTPLVFKPVAMDLQTIYSRLVEAEALLKRAIESSGWFINKDQPQVAPPLNRAINEYFDRHAQ